MDVSHPFGDLSRSNQPFLGRPFWSSRQSNGLYSGSKTFGSRMLFNGCSIKIVNSAQMPNSVRLFDTQNRLDSPLSEVAQINAIFKFSSAVIPLMTARPVEPTAEKPIRSVPKPSDEKPMCEDPLVNVRSNRSSSSPNIDCSLNIVQPFLPNSVTFNFGPI